MAKTRVYELAKSLGVESQVVVSALQEMGEFVRSASSTIEAPLCRAVERRIREGSLASTPNVGRFPRTVPPRSRPVATDRPLGPVSDWPTRRAPRPKRHPGPIPSLIKIFLDRMEGAHSPPFEDEYQRAVRESSPWAREWFSPNEVGRWLDLCRGITAETASLLAHHGITPDQARQRIWYGKRMADRPPIYAQVAGGITPIDAAVGWLADLERLHPADSA